MEESSLIKSVDKKPILGYFKRKEKMEVVHLDILIDHSVADLYQWQFSHDTENLSSVGGRQNVC